MFRLGRHLFTTVSTKIYIRWFQCMIYTWFQWSVFTLLGCYKWFKSSITSCIRLFLALLQVQNLRFSKQFSSQSGAQICTDVIEYVHCPFLYVLLGQFNGISQIVYLIIVTTLTQFTNAKEVTYQTVLGCVIQNFIPEHLWLRVIILIVKLWVIVFFSVESRWGWCPGSGKWVSSGPPKTVGVVVRGSSLTELTHQSVSLVVSLLKATK